MIRRQKVDTRPERQLIIGMVTSSVFLRSISHEFHPELLQADVSRIVADWCIKHLEEHNQAPGKIIQDVYEQKQYDGEIDDDLADDLADLLDLLSREYEDNDNDYGSEYHLRKARKYLNERRMRLAIREASQALQDGEEDEAQSILEGYRAVELEEDLGFNPFTNAQKIQAAFESFEEPLFTYPGALGRVFNNQFSKASFIPFLAPSKRGKTWWLDDIAFRAHRHRNRVALFQIGDLSEEQQTRRLHVRLCGRSYDPEYCGELKIPILDCVRNQNDECDFPERNSDLCLFTEPAPAEGEEDKRKPMDFEEADAAGYKQCSYCLKHRPREYQGAIWYKRRAPVEPLTWRDGFKAGKKWMERWSGGNDFRVVCRGSMRVNELESILEIWANRGWIPNVIVLDYVDLLEWTDARLPLRERINEVWKFLRRMSLKYDCCMVTATQSDTEGMLIKNLDIDNFSESGRKWDHVTGAYAINQTPDEKRMGVVRIGPLLGREGRFDKSHQAKVLHCLEIGRPHLSSYF